MTGAAPHAGRPRLLFFVLAARGGIAEYAHAQANAIAALGVEVTMLCSPDFYPAQRSRRYTLVPALRPLVAPATWRARPVRGMWTAAALVHDFATLGDMVEGQGFGHVLLDSYVEYMAPAWAGRLRRVARNGVVFGAVVHDPIRHHVVGPRWWHRWSVAAGYSFLREAFVHDAGHAADMAATYGVRATVVPEGPFESPAPARSRAETRGALDIPADALFLLAFGSIRDDKNLDLAIRALVDVPDAFLIVAGRPISSGDRPADFYRALAQELGVGERCRWQLGYVPHEEVAALFAAADVAVLTYSRRFVSASAVANVAAAHRTPMLASSGPGWLRTIVESYGLGVWVEPDSVDAIVRGLRAWLAHPAAPQWERFARENSWVKHAEIVVERLGLAAPSLGGTAR